LAAAPVSLGAAGEAVMTQRHKAVFLFDVDNALLDYHLREFLQA
jgi:hypothetical protein